MRIAVQLDNRDVSMLARAVDEDTAGTDLPVNGMNRLERSNRIWIQINWGELKLDSDEVDSIAGKLQGFGLLVAAKNMATQNTYVVLPKAHALGSVAAMK